MAFLLLLLAPLCSSQLATATPFASDTTDTVQKVWIFLDDRPEADSLSGSERWTSPLDAHYLARLREAGVRPIVQSRWFHAVSATLSLTERREVETLSFVDSTRRVASYGAPAAKNRASGSPSPTSPLLSSDDSLSLGPSRQHLARMNALPPLERGLDGHGVRVGFLDAHFRGFRHPAFASMRRDQRLVGLRTFTENKQSGNHGSAVASLTVGHDPGTLVGPAHGAEVLGATTEYTPYERNVEEDFFVAGLEWLQRHNVDVVNVSIGYTRFDEGERSYSPDELDGDTGMTTRAVDRAAQLGVTVVVSAGNSGCEDPDTCWYYVNTPADADSVISVGAVTPDSSLASFSSRGPTSDGRRKPDVVVQGQNLVAAWQDEAYAQVGGTSFASPQVTGVVAQMLQINPDLSPIEVRGLLRRTASQSDSPDMNRGWGIVNADRAIRRAEWLARMNPPSTLEAEAPYPNPVSSRVTIPLTAPSQASTLHVTLFDVLGRRVHTEKQSIHPGPNRVTLQLQSVPPGVYRYTLETDTGDRVHGTLSIVE